MSSSFYYTFNKEATFMRIKMFCSFETWVCGMDKTQNDLCYSSLRKEKGGKVKLKDLIFALKSEFA